MATKGNGGLGSSEEVREGQLMGPALERKQMHRLDRRNLQLHFYQSMFPDSFFTGRNVVGQDGAPIHVKLIDTSTGDVVRSGPESCVKLEVVVVEGDFNNEDADDWTQEDFECHVVKEREGKRPLLIGNLSVSLEGGIGSLGKFSFTDNSCWTRSKKFRLGVKVALDLWEDIRVREAITNPFAVKDRRGQAYEKHNPPALDDEVWRLKNINRNGPFHKRLDSKGISKVKDFLWLLGIDAQGLRKSLGSSMKDKTWDTLVEHAKTCDRSSKSHVYYADNMKNSGVVFKNMSELCGLIEDGEYHSAETLSNSQKVFADTLKKEAYTKWKDIVEYDGLLPLEMNPSKRARSSQTDVVAPESCPSNTDQRVSPAFLTHVAPQPGLVNPGLAVGAPVPCQPPSVPSGEAYENSMPDFEGGKHYSAETLSFSQKESEIKRVVPKLVPAMDGGSSEIRFGGSLQPNRMATEGNGGLGSSEEVREGQQMDPALERVAAFLIEDSTQNTLPWLESDIRRLVREAFEHFVKSGPASVAAFLMDNSTQNTPQWLEPYARRLVREAFGHFVKSGPASVAAFLMENSTQNTPQWLEPYARRLVREAFEPFLKSGPAMLGGSSVNRREHIQEPDRSIMQLRFQTSIPAHFFVGQKVEGQAGAICVNLIDATTGRVVASGALSSLTLDVVVLAGDFNNEDDDDWTWEHFKSKVEPSREGKGPLLEGDLQVPLKGGVGLLEDIKFTDISTCRPSGKFRLGVKVETGFFKGIRVREAKTDAFEVKHYKKKSEEKHVTRALDDDICTLKGIGKDGPFHKKLNDIGIFEVEDFLWKLGLDPEGLRESLGKSVSDKNWKTLGDHANESVRRGKSHVYYADKTKNSSVVFKNMSELCGLIEDGEYHSTETLSNSQKVFADNLKKEACAKWKDIVEYDGPLSLETNPSRRSRFSQTDLANRKRHGAMDILANQIPIEVGGDVDQLERWDPNPKVHCHLLDQLGDRVTDIAPLRFLWRKKLKASDVSGQQNRFVLPRNVVGDIIVHCLTIQQRDDLCNNGAEIQIAAFDEQGRKWVLKLKKTMQSGHNFGTYVLIRDWTKMVKANGWKEDDEIKIWGLPYGELRDQWRFGPDHDFSDITFVFTTTV